MGNTLVDYKTDAGVATITLNDAPLNAFTHEMMKDLDEAILDARFDNDVHVIIVTGHGDRFFCSGANVQMMSEVDPAFKYYFALHASETLNRLENTPKLVIAALNGHAVGGGLEIALACDLRIARKGGGKIGLPEVNLGILPAAGGTHRASRLMGKSRALQMMIEASNVDFDRGLELGLVNYVWEADSRDQFQAKVSEYARRFLPPDKAPLAVGRIKRAVQSGSDMPVEQAQALERELMAELWTTRDADEGLRAHAAKRKPRFSGQ